MTTGIPMVLALAAGLAFSAPAASSQTPVKDFARDIKDQLVVLRNQLHDVHDAFFAQLSDLRDQVAADTTTPAEAQDSLFDLIAGLHQDVAGALGTYTDAVEDSASSQLESIDVFPNAFVVGDSGLVDSAVRRARRQLAKFERLAAKRVHVLLAMLEKARKYDMVVDARAPLIQPMTPSDSGTAADAPVVPLRLDILLGGSNRLVFNDGKLLLGGSADPAGGDSVSVTIVRPGSAAQSMDATVDAASGRWSASFGDEAGLAEGNYAISVTQGSVNLSDSLGVQ